MTSKVFPKSNHTPCLKFSEHFWGYLLVLIYTQFILLTLILQTEQFFNIPRVSYSIQKVVAEPWCTFDPIALDLLDPGMQCFIFFCLVLQPHNFYINFQIVTWNFHGNNVNTNCLIRIPSQFSGIKRNIFHWGWIIQLTNIKKCDFHKHKINNAFSILCEIND